MITLAPLTDESIAKVLANLRSGDADEIKAAGVKHPQEMFERAAREAAYAGTVLLDGEPIAIFGVNPDSGDTGRCWMVGTDAISQDRHGFARASVKVIDTMRTKFPVLHNWVHSRNSEAIYWLRWLGFHVDEESPAGPDGLFYPFKMESMPCAYH